MRIEKILTRGLEHPYQDIEFVERRILMDFQTGGDADEISDVASCVMVFPRQSFKGKRYNCGGYIGI